MIVYGNDDRTDVYAHSDEHLRQRTRDSIVALIPSSRLDTRNPRDVGIYSASLGQRFQLCSDQRFVDQPAAAECSATLIDRDLVLTAGHCVPSLSECQRFRYVFNYLYEAENELATIDAEQDVYSCAELVISLYTPSLDFAVVKLDRPVSEIHKPAPVASPQLEENQPLVIIGFGSGIPAKIDDGGRVLDPRSHSRDWFGANFDSFGGNSGSGVFDTHGNVVGILVRGERDYLFRSDCNVVNTLPEFPDSSFREESVYAFRAIDQMCATDASSVLCLGTTGGVDAGTDASLAGHDSGSNSSYDAGSYDAGTSFLDSGAHISLPTVPLADGEVDDLRRLEGQLDCHAAPLHTSHFKNLFLLVFWVLRRKHRGAAKHSNRKKHPMR